MQLEIKKYLYDIQQAADLIAQFTQGKEFSDYQREPMPRLAMGGHLPSSAKRCHG